MSKNNVKIAVLGFSTTLMSANIIVGIIADIAKAFPDAGPNKINLVLTLPFLMATLFSLLAGPLSKFIAKKTLVICCHLALLAGCGIAYLLGGMSLHMLMITSILLGVSQGALSTLSMALIADNYHGPERGALMGLQSTFVTFGGMIILFIGATLAGINWKDSYLVLLVALPSLFLSMKLLPKDQPVAQNESESGGTGGINGAAMFYVISGFLYGIFMFVFQANVAFYISNNGLGGATTAGYSTSILVAAGGVTGILYGRLSQILKRFVMPIGLFATVIGFLLIIFVGNITSIFIAAACIGFGLTATIPTIMYNASVVVPQSASTMAIALINTGTNVGMFISPFVIGFLVKITGKQGAIAQFTIGAIGLMAVAILYIVVDGMISQKSAVNESLKPAEA